MEMTDIVYGGTEWTDQLACMKPDLVCTYNGERYKMVKVCLWRGQACEIRLNVGA